jgi:hypothetical protein
MIGPHGANAEEPRVVSCSMVSSQSVRSEYSLDETRMESCSLQMEEAAPFSSVGR